MVFRGIADAFRQASGNPSLAVHSASAAPLRYKPSDRCVLRLTAQPGGETVVAKLYADRALAASVHARMVELYDHQLREAERVAAGRILGRPIMPHPLVLLDRFGLTVAEDIRAGTGVRGPSVSGGAGLLTPRLPPEPSQRTAASIAIGLARLHAFPLPPGWPARPPRTRAAAP